uniref:DNA repair protein Crb2 Tudor domain-containing protein n=1 Tax=Ciona savignyi TaxID=51511 RepID=H2YJS2_CIOSA
MGDDAYKIRYYDGLVKVVKEDFLRPYSGEIPKLPPAPPKLSSPKRHRSEDNRSKAALGLNRPQSADRSRRVSESNSVDPGTRSKQAKISAPESRVRYKQGEQVLCRWTDRRFYPATVLKQKGIDHYLIKYYDNRKKVVKHDWLS